MKKETIWKVAKTAGTVVATLLTVAGELIREVLKEKKKQ